MPSLEFGRDRKDKRVIWLISCYCQGICTPDFNEGQQMQQLLHRAEEGRPVLISDACGCGSSGEKEGLTDSWIMYPSYMENKKQDLGVYLIWTEGTLEPLYYVKALTQYGHQLLSIYELYSLNYPDQSCFYSPGWISLIIHISSIRLRQEWKKPPRTVV